MIFVILNKKGTYVGKIIICFDKKKINGVMKELCEIKEDKSGTKVIDRRGNIEPGMEVKFFKKLQPSNVKKNNFISKKPVKEVKVKIKILNNKTIKINNKLINLSTPLQIKNGNIMLELNKKIYNFVGFNYYEKRNIQGVAIIISKKDINGHLKKLELSTYFNKFIIKLNGAKINLSPHPYKAGNKSFFPLRNTFKVLGIGIIFEK